MVEKQIVGPNSRLPARPLIFAAMVAGIIGFTSAFLRAPIHSGSSVLAPKLWIDHYFDVMTHPITIIIEIVVLGAAMKSIRDWRLLPCGAMLGMFFGMLLHKVL